MKAISLHQPHAEAMRLGLKKIETRSKRIHFRGDLAICSTRKLLATEIILDHELLKLAAEKLGG